MGWFWNVSVDYGEKGYDYQDYKINVYCDHRKFFGLDGSTSSMNYAALVDHNNTALRYLGFPIWREEWSAYCGSHTPYYNISNYTTNYLPVGSPYGRADCDCVGWNTGYTSGWIRCPIDRTNKRKGTKQISVGIRARDIYASDDVFGSSIKTITLETTETPQPEFSGSPTITVTDSNISITGTYNNADNFYKVQLLKKGTTTVLQETAYTVTSYDFNIPVTDAMRGTTITYVVRIIGRDGTVYRTSNDLQAVIKKKTYKIFAKVSGPTIVSNKNLFFKNNTTKREFKDVYIKTGGQIYKVKR